LVRPVLADVVSRLPPRPTAKIEPPPLLLVMHLGEATMRLAISVGRTEGDALIAACKRMVLAALCRKQPGDYGGSRP
jgi:hypothetical protein